MTHPTDIASLFSHLQAHPWVEQVHFDSDYGTRKLCYYGVCPFTGVFKFWVGGVRSGTAADVSFNTARSYAFNDHGFTMTYGGGTVSYRYLQSGEE